MKTATGSLGEGGGRFFQQPDSIADSEAGKFSGTENPRHLRALAALLRRPMPREHIDREAGCSNGPDLIAELRSRGLSLPCDRTPVIDRDGREVTRGVYHLTSTDRRKVHLWLATRGGIHGSARPRALTGQRENAYTQPITEG
jgi:hypothetical protein